MQVVFILIVSLIVLIISFKLFSAAAGTLSPLKLNTISYVFYVQIVAMTFVGSILVACNAVDYHYLIIHLSNKTKIYAWLGVLYSMIAMPIAMILLNHAFRIKIKSKFQNYVSKPIEFDYSNKLSITVLTIFTMISVAVLSYTFINSESIPILTLLRGQKELAAIQRVETRSLFGGIEYIRNLLGYLMMPIIAYYAAIFALEKRKLIYWIFFIANFLMASLLLSYDIQKAPLVFFFIGFLILYTLMRGGVTKKRFITYGIIALVLISGAYSVTSDKNMISQLTDFGSALWGRIFISEYAGYALSLEYFPDIITQPTWYIGLPSFVLSFFDLPNVESARLLMMKINPEGVASGEANLISSFYMGEAWANYGWIGFLLSPFIVGFVVQSVHLFLLRHKKEPLIMAFYSYLTVRWLLSSGFVYFLYLKIIIYPLIFYFLFRMLIVSLSRLRAYRRI